MSSDKRATIETHPTPRAAPAPPPAAGPGARPLDQRWLVPDRGTLWILGTFALLSLGIVWGMWHTYQRRSHESAVAELTADGRYAEAIPHLMLLLKTHPDDTSYLQQLAWCRLQAGTPGDALELFKQMLELAPTARIHDRMALCYLDLGQFDEARKAAEQALKDDPRNPLTQYVMGRLELQAGRPLLAAPYFQQAAQSPEWDKAAAPYRKQLADMVLNQAAPTTASTTTATTATTPRVTPPPARRGGPAATTTTTGTIRP